MASEFPTDDMELTRILVSDDVVRSTAFYRDVLKAEVTAEFDGGAVLRFLGNWLLLVVGGGPTDDKPTVTMAAPSDPDTVSASFTIRVKDCQGAYEELLSRGAVFLTPPVNHGREVRAFFRDPDGHLFEISELVS